MNRANCFTLLCLLFFSATGCRHLSPLRSQNAQGENDETQILVDRRAAPNTETAYQDLDSVIEEKVAQQLAESNLLDANESVIHSSDLDTMTETQLPGSLDAAGYHALNIQRSTRITDSGLPNGNLANKPNVHNYPPAGNSAASSQGDSRHDSRHDSRQNSQHDLQHDSRSDSQASVTAPIDRGQIPAEDAWATQIAFEDATNTAQLQMLIEELSRLRGAIDEMQMADGTGNASTVIQAGHTEPVDGPASGPPRLQPDASSSGVVERAPSQTRYPEQRGVVRDTATPTSNDIEQAPRILPGEWKEPVLDAIRTLEASLQNPNGLLSDSERRQQELTLRLLYLLSNNRDAALEPIALLDESEQSYWTEQIFALLELVPVSEIDPHRSHFRSHSLRNATAAQHLRRALESLTDVATLQVSGLALCRAIQGYGRYQEFETRTFNPGDEVLVYCEIANLAATQQAERNYQSYTAELQGSVQVYQLSDGEQSRLIDEVKYAQFKDQGRNRRLDFYAHFGYRIPGDLENGNYLLYVTVEDRIGRKTTTSDAPIEFRVHR